MRGVVKGCTQVEEDDDAQKTIICIFMRTFSELWWEQKTN